MKEKKKARALWRRLRDPGSRALNAEGEELRGLWRELDDITPPSPKDAEMPRELLNAIESEKRSAPIPMPRNRGWVPGLVAAAAVMGICFSLGYQAGNRKASSGIGDQVQQVRRMMMFSMLNRESPSERLRAVRYLKDESGSDPRIRTELLKVLDTDPNIMVRLECLYALSPESRKRSGLRRELARSLLFQNSQLLQLSLVEELAGHKDPETMNAFRALLERPDTSLPVRLLIQREIREFNQPKDSMERI